MIESRIGRLLHACSVLVVAIGIAGAMTLRGQTQQGLNTASGIAVHGYDVVAYVAQNSAVKGRDEFSHVWQGTTWRFASAANRDAFAQAPERFVPQFGGFCAYGVSRGYAVDVDPEAFAVVDGKLYLNYSRRVQATWNENRGAYIRKAQENWPAVVDDLKKK